MIIDFRQGIIFYPSTGPLATNQQFLTAAGGNVSLQTSYGSTNVAFAHGVENYLYTESSNVTNAWSSIPANTNAWLYWDISLLTAVRTFGFTIVPPIVSANQPVSPVEDQHWFNLSTTTMMLYHAGGWRPVVRVFAAKVNNSTFTPLGSNSVAPFAGTQVGVIASGTAAGRIIIDNVGQPIRRINGLFFTSEDDFFVQGSPISAVRLESSIFTGTALESVGKYQVVKFSQFGKINLATYSDTQQTTIAMCMQSLVYNQTGSLCVQGCITNPSWNWPTVGAPLWISGTIPGTLTLIDPHITDPVTFNVGYPPVARVITQNSIVFDQGMGGKGEQGVQGVPGITGASTIAITPYLGLTGSTVNVQIQQLYNQQISFSTTVAPLTTKGDLLTFSTVNTRLPVGPNAYVLTANSATSTGVEWAVAPGGSPLVYSDGNDNTWLGTSALTSEVSGSDNTAVGFHSLSQSTTGIQNTAVGDDALANNTTGNYNSAFGNDTLINNISGSGNVAIGNSAGFSETGSNTLYISNTSTVTPLIKGVFDPAGGLTGSVTVNGALSTTGQITSTLTTGTAPFVVSSTTQVANLNVATAGSATNANNVNLANDATSATDYLVFTNTATGNQPLKTNTGVSVNPNTATITATTFAGALNGNATTATAANALNSASTTVVVNAAIAPTNGQVLTATSGTAATWQTPSSGGVATDAYRNSWGGTGALANVDGPGGNVDNVAIGYQAQNASVGGTRNVAVGSGSLYNTFGTGNVGIGYQTLYTNPNGANNVAIGDSAQYSNNSSSGSNNIALGYHTLYSNNGGSDNIAIGYQALKTNGNRSQSIAIGSNTLSSASFNGTAVVAVGYGALTANTNGDYNVAVGASALSSNTTGGSGFGSNTAVGYLAGSNNTTGANNTFIGFSAGTDAVANITTQSNYIVLGDNSTANANIKVAWTVTSDARDKNVIGSIPLGLEFVVQLNPIAYQFKTSRTDDTPTGRVRYGFLAQEVVDLEPNIPVIINNEDPENLKYNESSLIPVLVKAIQDLHAEVNALRDEINTLKSK